jgi:hypothetical protein
MFKIIDTNSDDAPDQARPRQRRSRRNAWRDGLAAHSVIAGLEGAKSYRAFERAIVASFEPRSAIEYELILWLASLFWRLRRATAIETALLQRHVGVDHSSRVDTRNRNEQTAAIAHPRLSHRGRNQGSVRLARWRALPWWRESTSFRAYPSPTSFPQLRSPCPYACAIVVRKALQFLAQLVAFGLRDNYGESVFNC